MQLNLCISADFNNILFASIRKLEFQYGNRQRKLSYNITFYIMRFVNLKHDQFASFLYYYSE